MKKLIAAILVSCVLAGGANAQQQAGAQPAASTAQDIDANRIITAAQQVAQLVDAGKSGEVWEGSSTAAKGKVDKEAFVRQTTTMRSPLGQPVSRVWASVIRQSVPVPAAGAAQPGNAPPPGAYITVRFATRFSAGRTMSELISFRLDEGGTWRVAGYTLQ